MQSDNKQQGFVILLFIVVVVIIATLWLSTKHKTLVSYFKNSQITQDVSELNRVKQRLLQFAVLQPEIYKTSTTGVLQQANQIPSPGYFPCPDLDADGVLSTSESSCFNPFVAGTAGSGYVPDHSLAVGLGSCDGSQVCLGYVPSAISTRNIYFAEAGRFLYFLDERFANQNPNYVNDGQLRFAPLSPSQFDPEDSNPDNDPVLMLNGVKNYIALIVDPGEDGLDQVNLDAVNTAAAQGSGYVNFVSGTADLTDSKTADQIVGVSYSEWIALMAHRVCVEKKRFEGVDTDYLAIGSTDAHWYNDYHSTENPGGGHWRSWARVCP